MSCPPRCGLPLSRLSTLGHRTRSPALRDRGHHQRQPRSGAGCTRTRSAPGSTAPGSSRATRSSAPRPGASSICTPGTGRAGGCATTSSCSAPTRRPASRHACASIRACPRAPGSPARVEHEYSRGGAWAYLAALDVHRAKVFGRCEHTTGIEPFGRLVDPGHVPSPLPQCPARVLDRRQRLLASRPTLCATAHSRLPQSGPRSRPSPCQLAQPDRDLLLDRAAQSPHPQ